MDSRNTDLWPKNWTIYAIETVAVILLAILSISLEKGKLDFSLLLSAQMGVRIIGSLCIWFANRFTLEYILQSRIDSNKLSQFLPFELTVASVAVIAIGYLIFYPVIIYLNDISFVLADFLQGLFITSGLSLLIVLFYALIHIWKSWWSDGEFLFRAKYGEDTEKEIPDFLMVDNSIRTVKHDLREVRYFISESKIVFLVDVSGKKWVTQYTLAELENLLDERFFRLNRRILVSRSAVSQIRKLPNHRLLVTMGEANEGHNETISRYKSTRFKQWFKGTLERV